MKRIILVFLVIESFCLMKSDAQIPTTYDGTNVKPLTTNSNAFYFGEPFKVYFEFKNSKNVVYKYYKPQLGVNLKYLLKNTLTGEIKETLVDFWLAGKSQRENMKRAPADQLAYQPNEYGYYSIPVNQDFGTQKLNKVEVNQSSELFFRLRSVPVGNYELILQYYLYPSDQFITATYPFKEVDVPMNEKEAFVHYIKSSTYACNAHFWANKNYSPSHPDSYENFLKAFPKSIYSQYAFIDMVSQIYSYAGPEESIKVSRYKEYINYYPNLSKPNIKLDYVRLLPKYYQLIPVKNLKEALDKFLLKIKNENPSYSRLLIKTAEFRYKIKGLKSYAAANP